MIKPPYPLNIETCELNNNSFPCLLQVLRFVLFSVQLQATPRRNTHRTGASWTFNQIAGTITIAPQAAWTNKLNETQSRMSFFALRNDFYPVYCLKKKQAKS